MIFKGIDNQTVEFKIVNYQFPENKNGGWDGDWLQIYLKVKSKVGNWEIIDPSLTTWEVKKLIDWFEKLSKNEKPEYNAMWFTEPNLSFELLNSYDSKEKNFKIIFNLESRPKSADDDKEYYVDCLADNMELKNLSNELAIELNRFL